MISLLLVTADGETRKRVKAALEDVPVTVLQDCTSPKEAVSRLRDDRPVLVMVDYFQGGESTGLELLKTIKKMDENANVLLLSRVSTRLVWEKAYRFGACDVILIPTEEDTITQTVLHRLEHLLEKGEK